MSGFNEYFHSAVNNSPLNCASVCNFHLAFFLNRSPILKSFLPVNMDVTDPR